jgi:hypothetical protein
MTSGRVKECGAIGIFKADHRSLQVNDQVGKRI